MEPTQPIQPLTPAVPVQTATPTPVPKNKMQIFFENLRIKFNALPKSTRVLIFIMAVLFLIIFLLSILVAMFGKKQTVVIATSTPAPVSVTPGPNVILNASRYATDSGVLKIEENLKNIQKQLETTDVKQSDLNLPNLDYNINFNQ